MTKEAQATAPTPKPRKRWLRNMGIVAGAGVVAALVGWGIIHRYPQFAGKVVNQVRRVTGPKPIAWLEDRAYGVQDAYNRWRHKDAKPKTYWKTAPPPPLPPAPPTSSSAAKPKNTNQNFPPKNFAPPYDNVKADGDGTWIRVVDPVEPNAPSRLYKSLIHPDAKRSFALVAVVAVDLTRTDIISIAGWGQPKSRAIPRDKRPGLVPKKEFPHLIATFNGGFQSMHGNWGMKWRGAILAPPRSIGCTIARYNDGSMKIGMWKMMAAAEGEMEYFRQAPPCLVQAGVVNPAARLESNTGWGATVDRKTIIRRSALGLNKAGNVAYFGMGDALSAGSLARAMAAAGAYDVAQLDVNWAYPRFFFFDGNQSAQPAVKELLAPVQNWKPNDYVERPQYRDFFYLRRKSPKP